MKSSGLRMADGGWETRSVLECGSPLPLSAGGARPVVSKSARGLAQSKTWRSFVALCLLTSALCLPASGQYAIDWHTIDACGGTSTGSVYSVTGTIGQPDAGGPMTNGQYSVTGGFWAPTLTIAPASPGNATISWTPATPGFVLQETVNLSVMWTNSPGGATNPIVVPATLPTKFYRQFHP
jgi:hypothetical protein